MFTAIRRIAVYIHRILGSYARHLDALMAAAVSYYALLSIVPLLSVGVAVLGWVIGGDVSALAKIEDTFQSYLPTSGSEITDVLSAIQRDSGLLGVVGLLGLLLSASAIFTNLEIALNNAWGIQQMRPWWSQRLVALGTTVLAISLMFASIGITSLLTYVENTPVAGVDLRFRQFPVIWQLFGHAVPLCLSVLTFTLTYRIIPNKPILWREALVGGLFAGCAFEIAKYLFALYLAHFSNYNKIYGSLGGLVILVVWAYYTATIYFLGAEIAADYGTRLPAAQAPPAHMPHTQPRQRRKAPRAPGKTRRRVA